MFDVCSRRGGRKGKYTEGKKGGGLEGVRMIMYPEELPAPAKTAPHRLLISNDEQSTTNQKGSKCSAPPPPAPPPPFVPDTGKSLINGALHK